MSDHRMKGKPELCMKREGHPGSCQSLDAWKRERAQRAERRRAKRRQATP